MSFAFKDAVRQIGLRKGEDQPRDENGRWASGGGSGGSSGKTGSAASAVDAVISGNAKVLGEGDDGRVYEVGDKAVKVSNEVSPRSGRTKTEAESAGELARQGRLNNTLVDAGIPGILPVEVLERGGKTYLVRDKVDIPDRLTAEQLKQVRQSVDAMHEKGYIVGDEVQVGLKDDKAYQYDLGKARKSKAAGDVDDDSDAFERFSKQMGQPALPLRATAERALAELGDRTALMDEAEAKEYEARLRAAVAASKKD